MNHPGKCDVSNCDNPAVVKIFVQGEEWYSPMVHLCEAHQSGFLPGLTAMFHRQTYYDIKSFPINPQKVRACCQPQCINRAALECVYESGYGTGRTTQLVCAFHAGEVVTKLQEMMTPHGGKLTVICNTP